MIICGVPGAGKSTLAHYAVHRWKAVSHASESFTSQLGPAARDSAGDLTPEAIEYAYRAMSTSVEASLNGNRLVFAVGSFRSQNQRQRFRQIGILSGARVTTVRIDCPVETAAQRVRARRAEGENGPDEETIRRIAIELDRANDFDIIIRNDASIQVLWERGDAMILEGARF